MIILAYNKRPQSAACAERMLKVVVQVLRVDIGVECYGRMVCTKGIVDITSKRDRRVSGVAPVSKGLNARLSKLPLRLESLTEPRIRAEDTDKSDDRGRKCNSNEPSKGAMLVWWCGLSRRRPLTSSLSLSECSSRTPPWAIRGFDPA